MNVVLKYGNNGLPLSLPKTPGFVGVLAPSKPKVLADPLEVIIRSLDQPIGSEPLRTLARRKKSACIVVSDTTRPVPNALILPPILSALEAEGIPRNRIAVLIATGRSRFDN